MTTSVVYGSTLRYVDIAQSSQDTSAGATLSQIYTNLNTMLDTGVTLVQQINNSATGTNPNATFTNTPTNGNAMIAILARGGDNVASTGPAGWAQLTATGVAGTRRLEIWWKRAGASEAKLHTWTNATSGLWDLILIEFGGWASIVDPVTVNAAANATTNTSFDFSSTGILESVSAVVTSGGSAGTFTNTGTNSESVTNLPFTTTTRFRAMSVDRWTNRSAGQTNQISWTTSRPFTRAEVGWPNGHETVSSTLGYVIGSAATTGNLYAGQMGLAFATATIPDNDTVTSATLTLRAANVGATAFPANCAVNAYSLAAVAITADNSNTRTVWKKPTEIQALTRVATRAAGSAWVTNTDYNWTSDATFPAQINKTGNTTILIATGDQQTGTTRTTNEIVNFDSTATNHYLTVIHNLQATSTVSATATAAASTTRAVTYRRTLSPTVSLAATVTDIVTYLRTITSTITATPAITRTIAYLRTVAADLAVTPTITTVRAYARSITATITATPAIARVITFARTIAATITGTVDLTATKIPFTPQVARIVRLAGRSTLKLTQIVTARLGGRSTIRAPKE